MITNRTPTNLTRRGVDILKFQIYSAFYAALAYSSCASLLIYQSKQLPPYLRHIIETGGRLALDEEKPFSLVTPPHTQQFMGNGYQMASSNMVTRIDGTEGFNSQSIEERNFQAALIMTECHFTRKPPIGRKTVNMTLATIKRTMEKTLNVSEIRYDSKCLDQDCR